jgi:hypothetical protein
LSASQLVLVLLLFSGARFSGEGVEHVGEEVAAAQGTQPFAEGKQGVNRLMVTQATTAWRESMRMVQKR